MVPFGSDETGYIRRPLPTTPPHSVRALVGYVLEAPTPTIESGAMCTASLNVPTSKHSFHCRTYSYEANLLKDAAWQLVAVGGNNGVYYICVRDVQKRCFVDPYALNSLYVFCGLCSHDRSPKVACYEALRRCERTRKNVPLIGDIKTPDPFPSDASYENLIKSPSGTADGKKVCQAANLDCQDYSGNGVGAPPAKLVTH